MFASLEKAKGDFVAIMDVDLQDPPELLIDMYNGFSKSIFSRAGFKTKWLEYKNVERSSGTSP